jgi:hypothetical protein
VENVYHERELKYLLTDKNAKLSIEQVIDALLKCGYELGERKGGGNSIKTRTKLEEYFDDSNFSLYKKGHLLRRTRHIWYDKDTAGDANFMYKENVGNADEIYASRMERKNYDIQDLYEFVKTMGIEIIPDKQPKLTAIIKRNDTVMTIDDERFYITHDVTTYQNPIDNNECTETMLEIEDKVNLPYDRHLYRINDEMLKSGLSLKLTKQNKYARGCEILLLN